MRPPARPGLVLVATRELRWFLRDRVALFVLLGIPLIGFAVLAGAFSSAVVRGLGVTVVDADRTPTSMLFVQAMAAAPGVTVTHRAEDLAAATRAIRSGEALAAAYIPPDFERDLLAGRRPQLVVFYNTQFMTPGNIAGKGLREAVTAAAAAMAPVRAAEALGTPIGPLVVEQYVLTNPALNYAQFLLRAVMPTVLHVVIAIATGYAVGSEFSRRSVGAWLRCAGGSPLTAVLGKLLPLFGVFMLLMVVVAGVLHGLLQVPFRGDAVMVGAAACLFVLAYQGLSALIQLLVRNLPLGLSLIAIIVSPAFGYAGIGFPVVGMEAFPRLWGQVLPLRWYLRILFDQAARGTPVHASAGPFAVLAAMALVFLALAWLRLRFLAEMPVARHPQPAVVAPASGGISSAFAAEWRRVLSDRNVFGLMVLAPLLYGLYYPQPYLGQILRDVPIAVVDQDQTALSRELVQMLDAHEALTVAVRADTLAEAQRALFDRRVFAIVDIPVDTERDVLKGVAARLPAYVDSTYMMLYNRTWQGVSDAADAVAANVVSHGARADGNLYRAALAAISPVELLMAPLFNPTGGYANYVVPAAFVLILQQTLLMGSAMLTSGGATVSRRPPGLFNTMAMPLGRAIAHLTLYLAPLGLFLVVLPRVYGFSTLGRPLDLFLFAVPFILATSLMGQTAGAWFRRRETAVVLFIATTLPQFFLVGVSWPAESIPPALRAAGRVFPSESAIDGLVRINQMGASLSEVRPDWMALWALAGAYLVLSVLSARFGAPREPAGGA